MNIIRLILVAIAVVVSVLTIDAQTIGHIERNGSWYRVYDQNGKQMRTLSASTGDLVGYSSTMFILRNGSWYYLYGADGRREKTFSVSSIGEVLNVSSDSFTSKKGSWIYTWSREGRQLNCRWSN